jgi:hypothetical protein
MILALYKIDLCAVILTLGTLLLKFGGVTGVDVVPIICEAPSNLTQAQLEAVNHLPCPSNVDYLQLAIGHALNVFAEQAGLLDTFNSLPYPDFSDIWWEQDDVAMDIWHDDYFDDALIDDTLTDDTYNDDTFTVRRNLRITDAALMKEQNSSASVLGVKDSAIVENINEIENKAKNLNNRRRKLCYCKKSCTAPVGGCFLLWCGNCVRRRLLEKKTDRKLVVLQSLAELATNKLRSLATTGSITDASCLQYLNTVQCREDSTYQYTS